MKKIICAILAVCLLISLAYAEGNPAVFSCEDFSITLPEGMRILAEQESAGYEAAVEADFPNAAETMLAAVSEDEGKAITVSLVESKQDGLAAAKEAAEKILGSSTSVKENTYGKNTCGSLICAVGDLQFELYYLSKGEKLMIVGFSGLERTEIEETLSGISF